jgi:hypothetical protein
MRHHLMLLTCLLAGTTVSHAAMRPTPRSCQPAPDKQIPKVCQPTCNTDEPPPLIEFKVGYFFFSSSPMNQVYDQGGIDLQISGAYPIQQYLRIYGSVEYLQKSGHSLGGHERTSYWALPLSLGLQPVFKISSYCSYYFTLGPRYFFARVHNHSSLVPRHMKGNNIGGFANTGFQFIISKHFLIDVFGEYSYARLAFHPSTSTAEGHTVQVGGFTFGAALGYAF